MLLFFVSVPTMRLGCGQSAVPCDGQPPADKELAQHALKSRKKKRNGCEMTGCYTGDVNTVYSQPEWSLTGSYLEFAPFHWANSSDNYV